MRSEVLCYSLTGNTAQVCEVVAKRLGTTCHRMTAPVSAGGFWTIVRLGFATLFGRRVKVQVPEIDLASADLLVLGTPVWVGRPSLPVREWLESRPELPRQLALVVTSGDLKFPDKTFDSLAELTGRTVVSRLHVSEAEAKSGEFGDKLEDFLSEVAATAN